MSETTLRDQFAMAALQGLLDPTDIDLVNTWMLHNAQLAYRIADAMLKARVNPPEDKS